MIDDFAYTPHQKSDFEHRTSYTKIRILVD